MRARAHTHADFTVKYVYLRVRVRRRRVKVRKRSRYAILPNAAEDDEERMELRPKFGKHVSPSADRGLVCVDRRSPFALRRRGASRHERPLVARRIRVGMGLRFGWERPPVTATPRE